MDLGLEGYRIDRECGSIYGGAGWDTSLPSGLNERVILEKQKTFWSFLEKSIIARKLFFHINEPEQ